MTRSARPFLAAYRSKPGDNDHVAIGNLLTHDLDGLAPPIESKSLVIVGARPLGHGRDQ